MRKVSGYVLIKESGTGVPNLVVSGYDSKADINELRRARGNDFISKLGRCIGSILTDANGRFVLGSEDLDFTGNEARPNLVIAVFASEDVQSLDNPFPLSPEERILYVSAAPRVDAGAEEAYVIRLLQAQVDRYNISLSNTDGQGPSGGGRFLQAAASTWAFRDSIKKNLSGRLQKEADKTDKRRQDAKLFVKDLSAIPLHLRDGHGKGMSKNALRNNDYLIQSKSDLAVELPKKQTAVVSDALTRLNKSKTKPKVRLHLTKEQVTNIGLTETKKGITGAVDSAMLAKTVRSFMSGVDLVKVRGLTNPSTDDLTRRYLSPTPIKPARPTKASMPARNRKAK